MLSHKLRVQRRIDRVSFGQRMTRCINPTKKFCCLPGSPAIVTDWPVRLALALVLVLVLVYDAPLHLSPDLLGISYIALTVPFLKSFLVHDVTEQRFSIGYLPTTADEQISDLDRLSNASQKLENEQI